MPLRALILIWLLIPLTSMAVSGTWSASSAGSTLTLRSQVAKSAPLAAPVNTPVSQEKITSVNWRYKLLGPTPTGLQVKLCTEYRCIELDGQSGKSFGLAGQKARQPLRFIFYVAGVGVLNPPLRVVSQQIDVNYN